MSRRRYFFVTAMLAAWSHVSVAAGGGRAIDDIVAGQGRELRFEIVGFASAAPWLPTLRAANVVVTGRITPRHYDLTATLKSVGLTSLFSKVDDTLTIRGVVDSDGLRTQYFSTQDNLSGRLRTAVWGKDDVEVTESWPPENHPGDDYVDEHLRYFIPPEQKIEGVDFLTAMLNHMIGATEDSDQPCQGRLAVYDSARRYDMALSFDENVYFNDGVWKGQVDQCRLDLEYISVDLEEDDRSKEKEKAQTILKFAELDNGKLNFLVAADVKVGIKRLKFVVNKIVYKRI